MSIYRLRDLDLQPRHLDVMRQAANELLGEDYDFGQALDIAINYLLGYPHLRKLKLFDLGRKKKVCSVGVRAAFEYLNQNVLAQEFHREGKWLFRELNPEKWPPEAIARYRGTDVEATSPAHFANSDLFGHEFELVARFDGGRRLFPGA